MVRRTLRPRTLADEARQITAGRLQRRLSARSAPAELEQLAQTLNGMLARLQQDFARLTGFSGDLAHELRTRSPICSPRCRWCWRTRAATRPIARRWRRAEEPQQLAQTVGDLLYLAQPKHRARCLRASRWRWMGWWIRCSSSTSCWRGPAVDPAPRRCGERGRQPLDAAPGDCQPAVQRVETPPPAARCGYGWPRPMACAGSACTTSARRFPPKRCRACSIGSTAASVAATKVRAGAGDHPRDCTGAWRQRECCVR